MEKAADRMRRLCSRREYCVSDIRRKLMNALDGDLDKVRKVLDDLIREKYVDDLRYARAYARDKASIAGWGKVKIRYMLSSKGVAKEIISEALEDVDEDKAAGRLEKLIEHKYKALKEDPQCRLKLLRFALGRGYSYEEAETVVKNFLK